MFRKFGLILSAVLGLLAFAIPSSARSAAPADSTSRMNVQFNDAGTIATPAPPHELAGRRRAPRRGGNPAPCPACGMG